jgi:hypothetical protein
MLTRVVLFKWKPEASQEQIDDLVRSIMQLKHKVPGVIEMKCAENVGGPPCGIEGGGGYTHVVVATFPDGPTLDLYRAHPEHLEVVKKIDAIEDKFLLFQINM